MSRRQSSETSSSRAERNPFRCAVSIAYPGGDEIIEEVDMETLRKQERAIRSFTESVELDSPPPPELPSTLDIDQYPEFGMRESSTADTIIDVAKLSEQEQIDRTKGETQKYRMTVPGPEQVDQEIELHKSLLKNAEPDEIEEIVTDPNANFSKRERPTSVSTTAVLRDPDSQALKRQYSSNAVQRPRPTTPTSWCVIDAYVQADEERGGKRRESHSRSKGPPDAGARIKVLIPNKEQAKSGQRGRRNSMSWSDFYESMEQPAYKQSRSDSLQAGERNGTQIDFDSEWENAKTKAAWNREIEEAAKMASAEKEVPDEKRRTSTQSSRRASKVSQTSKHSDSQQPTTPPKTSFYLKEETSSSVKAEEGHVVPVRAAPPPPPKKKVEAEVVPTVSGEYGEVALQSEFGDPSQFYQGYGDEAYGAVGYDPAAYSGQQEYDYSTYGTAYDPSAATYDPSAATYDPSAATYDPSAATYDPSAYAAAYDQTQYDANAYAGYDTTTAGYEQYYQGYGDYNPTDQTYTAGATSTEQAYTYDPVTGQYTYEYAQEQATYEYDPSTYNAGYDQYGLQTTVVGADDTDTSASVSPRPDISPSTEDLPSENATSTNYDYSQYDYSQQQDYSSYPTTDYGGTNVTVNEPDANAVDAFDTSAYETMEQPDYSAYGAQPDTTDYTVPEPSTLVAPLLPQQRPRTPDPFSWETQERNYEDVGTALPPPRPPPMARTPEVETVEKEPEEVIEEEIKAEPPSRPAPLMSKQPPRPPPPPSGSSPSRQMPPPPPLPTKSPVKQQEKPVEVEEEDPWARFKQMSEQVSSAVKSTEAQLKNLSETTSAKDIKDESYVGKIGGTQHFELNSAQKQTLKMQEEQKKAKADKKARKSASSKKNVVPQFDPKKEEDVERAAAELVAKLTATRAHDLEGWKPPSEMTDKLAAKELSPETPESPPPTEAEEEEEVKEVEEKPNEQRRESTKSQQSIKKEEEIVEEEPAREGWAGFDIKFDDESTVVANIPPSESDFFSTEINAATVKDAFGDDENAENGKPVSDPFAPTISAFDADPFDTRPIDEIVAEAKQKAELEGSLNVDDSNLLHGSPATTRRSTSRGSTPTPEGGSPISSRPMGFEDEFKVETADTPLYDEDDTQPLEEFAPKFSGEGWELMIRHPLKKKNFMSERCWKPCFVRLRENDNMLRVFNAKDDDRPILEILLQASYSLSDNTLQAYDAYGKIHTVKLQHVLYKERVGIRAGQISRLVEGHITKYGLPLEHAAQINVLAKFACLQDEILKSFITVVEDILFKCPSKRDSAPTYKQDEVQIHCYDEYTAHVDKMGNVSDQRARVRMFCLSFLTGSPFLEIGLNDRRREGKEIVRRKDILPMYTERWIRFEGLEFHNTVEQPLWDEDQVIKLQPPDSCFFEIMRFRVRPPRNREKSLTVKSIMKIAGSKVEIRIDVMAAAQQQLAKGTVESTRSIPCEDIQIRFPIPDAWIYIFREERTWGVGSVHSKTRRPGKVKNLKDRLIGAVQHTESTLIEVAIGEAKYEHVYRALVWRIPRLPEKHHQAYKSHMLKCRFQLSSFDLMPEEFLPSCGVEFTMPLATISHTVVRSISVEQHEDSDRVEKFVRYVAKCHYDLDIDYVQCNNLDNDLDSGIEIKKHEAIFNPDEVKAQHEGYKVEVDESKISHDEHQEYNSEQPSINPWENNGSSSGQTGGDYDFESYARQGNGGAFGASPRPRNDSSSEEEDEGKFPVIQIDMSSYGY